MRDLEKAIEDGRKIIARHERAALNVMELAKIRDLARKRGGSYADILIRAIEEAFYAGVAIGARQMKRRSEA